MIWQIIITIVGVLYSAVLHEIGHCLMARFLIDNKACSKQRLSLNPMKHIDGGTFKTVKITYPPLTATWRKSLVVFAGPLVNILIATLAGFIGLWILFGFNIFWLVVNLFPRHVEAGCNTIVKEINLGIMQITIIFEIDGSEVKTDGYRLLQYYDVFRKNRKSTKVN